MSIIIKNKLNKDFQVIHLNKSKTSILSKNSDNQSSNSKLGLKENNNSDVTPIRVKNVPKSSFAKCRIEQISNFRNNNKTRYSASVYKRNSVNLFKRNSANLFKRNSANLYKRNKQKYHLSWTTLNSLSTEKLFSMKTLEKNIQQKIIDISMKIEKESTSIINEDKDTPKINASLFIKKKLGLDSDVDQSSFVSKNNLSNQKKKMNKSSFTNPKKKRKMYDFSLKAGDKETKEYHSFMLLSKSKKKKRRKEKFRNLLQKNNLYDSFDSEEEEEIQNFFISPDNKVILIIDLLIIIYTLFNMILTPYLLSNTKCFCFNKIKYINIVYIYIDILYIIDLIFGFFRAYHNFQFQLITNNKRIMRHYLRTQFIFDLIQAIPFFSYMTFLCRKSNNNIITCAKFSMKNTHMILILCCLFKLAKLFKMINIRKNTIYYKVKTFVSQNDWTEKLFDFFVYFFVCLFCFYLSISIHIFIGNNTYPNWIIKSNSQDKRMTLLYLTSFYYLITTMTTVGYGDIVCGSVPEIVYQIFLLSAGIIVYSFIISSIGNYVKNESHASMKFDKDEAILEEIRISYPNMPFKLYNQIFHHLSSRKIREQHCDSNILINSLPYSLKNNLLLTIHQQTIKNFKIFRGYQNTDFTLRILTNFIPIVSRKNALLIREGEIIENMIFVKEGKLSLEASINIDDPGKSIMQYLTKNFIDINEDVVIISNYDTSFRSPKYTPKNYQVYLNRVKSELDRVVNYKNKGNYYSSINESNIGKELGKWDFDGECFEENNYQFLHIINISKNESYGSVYMLLSKPSPLSLRVKTKKAELLLLRKNNVNEISSRYPNIWAKYFKKAYLNMLSIKSIALHKIKHYWINLGKELFKAFPTKKEKSDSINDIKDSSEKKQKEKVGIIINIKDCDDNNDNNDNNINENMGTNIINNNNMLTKSNRLSQVSLKSSKNVTFKNSDLNKYISFNKDINILKKKSFQTNQYNKKYRGSFSLTMHNNTIGEKRASKKSFGTGTQFTSLLKNRPSFNKLSSLYQNKLKSSVLSGNMSSTVSKRNIQSLRIEYLKKLQRKIHKLQKTKKYYKDLCKKFYSKETKNNEKKNEGDCGDKNTTYSFDKNQINKRKSKHINTQEGSIQTIPDINISRSSKETTSFSTARSFNLDEITIATPIQITYNAKYKNLDSYSYGEYSNNRNLRKNTLKFIKFYLTNFPRKKCEKKFETIFSSLQSFNTSNIENEFYPSCSPNNKSNISNTYKKKKSTDSNVNTISEKNYLIVYDFIKDTFNLIQKKNFMLNSKLRMYTKNITSKSQKNNNESNEYYNNNNNLKKPSKSLFNIKRNSKRSRNDDTLREWEHSIEKKNSDDLEYCVYASYKKNSIEDK